MLVWALVAFVIVAGVVFAGGRSLSATARDIETRFRREGQAQDVARAGLVDAYAWFRRQATQPVTTFAPQRDLLAVPPINETDDASIGLVREFEIAAGVWGRYECRVWSDRNGNGRADPGEGVRDVTAERNLPGTGTVWLLESNGFVYRRVNGAVAWDQAPNQRIARAVAATEIRRLNIAPPGIGALCCARGDAVTIGAQGRIDGAAAGGVLFPQSTGVPLISGQIAGTPTFGTIPGYDGSVTSVFGMPLDELKGLATIRMPSADPLPDPIPDYSFVMVEGDLTITPAMRLRGVGMLVVDGDLTIEPNTNTFFGGLIYVTGDYVQESPSLVRGVVIVAGAATVTGVGDRAELVYDGNIVTELMQKSGQYRLARATRRVDRDVMGAIR